MYFFHRFLKSAEKVLIRNSFLVFSSDVGDKVSYHPNLLHIFGIVAF